MAKYRHISILLIAVGSILFFTYMGSLQTNTYEAFEDPTAVKAIHVVSDNYIQLQKQLTTKKSLESLYNSKPLSGLISSNLEDLKESIELYHDRKLSYAEVKQKLKQMIKDFNEIIRIKNINLLNLTLNTLMPELPIEKSSLSSPVYKTSDEYTTTSDESRSKPS